MGRKGKALSYNVIVLTSSSYERSQYSPHNQCTAKILMLFTLSFLLEGDWRGEGGWGDDGVVESGGGAKTIVGHFI